jgi:hypothetical protein
LELEVGILVVVQIEHTGIPDTRTFWWYFSYSLFNGSKINKWGESNLSTLLKALRQINYKNPTGLARVPVPLKQTGHAVRSIAFMYAK